MLRYLGLLLLIPLLDSLFLVFVATQIGAPLTVLLVVLTALLGLLLVRAESRHTIGKIQRKLAAGELPTDELLDGAFLLVAGALTITPGLVTDVIGILLVVPFTRAPIRWAVREKVIVPYMDKKSGGFATGNVYIGGFPFGQAGQGPGAGGPGAGGPGPGQSGDAYDLDDDAYDIDFDDDSDRRRGVE
ncbi:FxsA family protein [Halosimplex aquaticum]|uniref:FxsA family protein n=1 Tax=Halosimplex aquaticum TaxID=3026162 RepID=A0ABD5XXX1_9EURY|nr:FxsA family protein [Halosimplex aquaticum]